MKDLIFATANPHKIKEIRAILDGQFNILGLDSIGCTEDIPETRPTIEGNALQKAEYVVDHYGVDCFAEDTGLEIDALDGEPGVYSARYAGPEKNSEANIQLALRKLEEKKDRSAQFKTVIALIQEGKTTTFEGIVRGRIIEEKRGSSGFGYDPVFVPDGYEQTFAEMDPAIKNQISHRARAVEKLKAYLLGRKNS
jgi:XTP/dITP diphosphohydrolase